ncbi:type IV pili methyl-accepting chemotaxis transducer N-terminal domain-containing protein [Teredinibacter purpureus]|jgi:hypothetical protein|uniref:type IV pili methyl-accepting chemotaxis transducer N-terminal domain-containing protein n=1 Tax=Teredinibacter purpureus TaxID=2731756 RepID=UPI0005F7A891|nr:type IV pili methyl-accepting chemotaxis transducer N-terminal domain-containing protein [Teredinibacter purpureus]
MKSITLLLLMFFASETLALTMGDAINVAGRQRMLSQRITQSFILTGIQPENVRYQKQLRKCVAEFQVNLDNLLKMREASPLMRDLIDVREQWNTFKPVATGPVSKKNAAKLNDISITLLTAAHRYVGKLEKLANSSNAELVNISGRQRMLSQRIAKNYLAYYWQIDDGEALQNLYSDLAEYELMLKYLKESDINTDDILRKILKTEGHLEYASKGFDGDMTLKGDRLIFVITGTTDIMLRNMDEITRMYAKLLDTQDIAIR